MIRHQKISLFDAPHGSIILHACNSQGVWGSGIAKPFKMLYPTAFKAYAQFVERQTVDQGSACGRGFIIWGNWNHNVGVIVTSHNYGQYKDPPGIIKSHTFSALFEFCETLTDRVGGEIDVYSNKFNSGLFGVPWDESEEILTLVLKYFPNINWIVCDPEGN